MPIHANTLILEEKRIALEALCLITEKRDGRIKGRKVAVGSKERTYDGYDMSDGSSPTVQTDSITLAGVIDAHERRDTATMDIGNAYLTAENDENIVMVLRAKLAEMMVRVNPDLYRPYIIYSAKGVPMLYVCLSKALYGMLRAALLFYKKLRGELESMRFKVNPYDPCVANKTIKGAQCTVCWHVDDLKISHIDPNVVTKVCDDLSKIYRGKCKIHRGGVHDYLGMDLDYESKPGTLIILMIKYLQKITDKWPKELTQTRACPAGDHLFTTRDDEDREILPPEMASQFQRTTAQLLFLTMRARPDIQTAVSFSRQGRKN